MSEKLDNVYKITKVVCLIVGVLALASTTVAGIAVGHFRIESLTDAVEEASKDRISLHKEIHGVDKAITTIQSDVRWIREALEKGKL